jgi:hypothetical protein
MKHTPSRPVAAIALLYSTLKMYFIYFSLSLGFFAVTIEALLLFRRP